MMSLCGYRKLIIGFFGILCLAVLAALGKLTSDASLGITGIACAFLGVHAIADRQPKP